VEAAMMVQPPPHGVEFILATGIVSRQGRSCQLTPLQIDLLEVLLDAYPRGLPASDLVDVAWPDVSDEEFAVKLEQLRVFICRMRTAMRGNGLGATIMSRRGQYALVVGDDAEAVAMRYVGPSRRRAAS
jgi:DNA-binding winged helix-turn-helix (wHTH) protein